MVSMTKKEKQEYNKEYLKKNRSLLKQKEAKKDDGLFLKYM